MNSKALSTLTEVGAVLHDTHVIYTSGRHGSSYINKDAIYPHTALISQLCKEIATHFKGHEIDVVLAPAIGGVILSQWVAHHLSALLHRDILSVYAEKTTEGSHFILKRGYDHLVRSKRTLVVEDVLTTGGSLKKVVEIAGAAGAEVVGAAALCNRGAITAEDLKTPELFALVSLTLESWEASDCPLCKKNVPVNTEVGKGKALKLGTFQ
jgi:orotate phosphoribosyltransferase